MTPSWCRAPRAALVVLLLALGVAPARAQFGGGVAPPHDIVKVAAAPVTVAAGGTATAEVRITIASGWHANANPPAPDYMIPTEVRLPSADGLSAGRVEYPPGEPLKLGFEENPVSVYSGTLTVPVPLRAAAATTSGRHTLHGTVRFQTCDNEVCMPPAELSFTLEVEVTGGARAPAASGAAPDRAARAAAPDTQAEGAPPAATTSAPTAAPARHGLAWLLALVRGEEDPGQLLARAFASGGLPWFVVLFLFGLALNLTPCVFPMLGITVSVFGARKQEPPLKVVSHAIAYVLGICVMYSVTGVVAALTGGLFGSALQNPLVTVGLGVLFVVLALSMFGLYEMQPPAWLLTRLGGADATSLAGIFLSGLAVGVIAAPCVGPIVLAVLALVAQRADWRFGLETMFTLSLGLGFPYLLLAVFSNLLQRLPRSGDWMLWVKHLFGVLLVGIGLYYVLLGLAPEVAPWVTPLTLLAGGVYLGFVDPHGARRRGFRVFRWVLGVAAVVAGVAAVVQLRAEGIRFQPYTESAMQTARAQRRPVLLDFSASWCLPCRRLDRETFTDRRVIAASRRFVTLTVDLTHSDTPAARAAQQRFGVVGVPAVLFVGADGRERRGARVEEFVPAEEFLRHMQAGLER